MWADCPDLLVKLQIHGRLQNALQQALSSDASHAKYLALVNTGATSSLTVPQI